MRHGGLVAGSLGPLNVTLSLSPKVDDPSFRTVDFDQVYAAYAEQIEALRDGGVDLLLIETIFDTLNAKAAIAAAIDVAPDLPRWISVTIVDRSGRTLSGQTVEAFWTSVAHADPVIVGVNCSLGAREMRPSVEALATGRTAPGRQLPERGSAERLRGLRRDPRDHERAARRVRGGRAREPRRRLLRNDAGAHPRDRGGRRGRRARDPCPPSRTFTSFSGLEPFRITPETGFVMVGERTNITGSKRFARLDRVRRLPGGGGRRARPGGERREPDRREHGHRPDRRRGRDDPLPQPRRDRAGDREGPDHGRLLEVGRDRGRPEVRPGQGGRQFDQPEGGRGRLPREGRRRCGATARRSW